MVDACLEDLLFFLKELENKTKENNLITMIFHSVYKANHCIFMAKESYLHLFSSDLPGTKITHYLQIRQSYCLNVGHTLGNIVPNYALFSSSLSTVK